VVATDILNEPPMNRFCGRDEVHLASLYERIGTEIHASNPQLLLIYEDNPYGRYLHEGTAFSGNPPVAPDLPGGVYSPHFYPREWTKDGEVALRDMFDQTQAWNVPMWIGEFNTFKRSITDDGWKESLDKAMAYTKAHGIGWDYWNSGIFLKESHAHGALVSKIQAGY
jgi:hypothetical protein